MNINLEDDAPLYPNELLQPAPFSCPCLPSSASETANGDNQTLETIINRNDADTNNDSNYPKFSTFFLQKFFSQGLLKSLPKDGLGMDLPSSLQSFKPSFDDQIENYLHQWKSDLDDIVLQPTANQQQSSAIDAPLPSKIRLGGLFDIPLPELKFHPTIKDINKAAEQQLNRSYAIELNPNEKLGDFRLRVPDMAIEVFSYLSLFL